MNRRLVVLAAALVLAAVAARGTSAAPPAPEGTNVRFPTDDGLSIAATWWSPGGEGGPAVVLLPMYGGARSSWRAIVPHLLERGMNVLAVDPRGHGESSVQGGVDLSLRVKARDASLFAETWRDVVAAGRWLVEDRRCDPRRIGLLGASVGASVALDVARRRPDLVAAVIALTPGPRYLGLDSVAHARELRADLPVAFVTHRDESSGVTEPVWTALTEGRAEAPLGVSRLRVLDVAPPPGAVSSKTTFHGLRMLGAVPLLEDWIADWLARSLRTDLDAPLLDGEVADEMAEETGGAWSRAPALACPEGVVARAFLRGTTRTVFAGTLPQGTSGLRLLVHVRRGDPRRPGHAWGNLDAACSLPGGEMSEGTTDASSAAGWPEPPVVLLSGRPAAGARPFEGVVYLPPLAAEGPVQVWMTLGTVDEKGAPTFAPGVRRDDPSTWVEITRP